MKLHKEGTKIIATTTVALLLINGLVYGLMGSNLALKISGVLSLGIWVLVTQFFRVPTRNIVGGNKELVCPCDGKVVVIEKVQDHEYFKDERWQISIFMSPLNVHVNWNPIAGIIKYYRYHSGKFLVAWHPKSSIENEMTTTVIETSDGQEVLVRQIAGAVARRIVNYMDEGQSVDKGQELGFIKFGSRVDILLPISATINVELDQVVKARNTLLAELS